MERSDRGAESEGGVDFTDLDPTSPAADGELNDEALQQIHCGSPARSTSSARFGD